MAKNPAGLLVSIYRNGLGDATNGGITSDVKSAVLIGKDIPEIFEPSNNTPGLELELFNPFRDLSRAFIIAKPLGQRAGMFGGNFIYTSDSRFPFDYPIKVYDRYES